MVIGGHEHSRACWKKIQGGVLRPKCKLRLFVGGAGFVGRSKNQSFRESNMQFLPVRLTSGRYDRRKGVSQVCITIMYYLLQEQEQTDGIHTPIPFYSLFDIRHESRDHLRGIFRREKK